MGLKYLIDTNCINALLLNTNLPLQKKINKGAELFLSVISIIEYFSNPKLSATNKNLFEILVNTCTVLDLHHSDNKIIQKASSLRKKYNLKIPDGIIASQAILNNLTLITNDADFKKIFGLQVEQLNQ